MFNPTAVVIDAFVNELRKGYVSTYTNLELDYPGIIDYVGHMALELIANSDAPYHDLGHTMCVTLVGQEVLRGQWNFPVFLQWMVEEPERLGNQSSGYDQTRACDSQGALLLYRGIKP